MRYEVLGPVQARLDDVVVAVGGPQQRRLLALLLSQPGQSVSSQRLVDCLWPDGLAPDRRRAFGDDVRVTAPCGAGRVVDLDGRRGLSPRTRRRVDRLAAVRGVAR